jgi:hypothetical protein
MWVRVRPEIRSPSSGGVPFFDWDAVGTGDRRPAVLGRQRQQHRSWKKTSCAAFISLRQPEPAQVYLHELRAMELLFHLERDRAIEDCLLQVLITILYHKTVMELRQLRYFLAVAEGCRNASRGAASLERSHSLEKLADSERAVVESGRGDYCLNPEHLHSRLKPEFPVLPLKRSLRGAVAPRAELANGISSPLPALGRSD